MYAVCIPHPPCCLSDVDVLFQLCRLPASHDCFPVVSWDRKSVHRMCTSSRSRRSSGCFLHTFFQILYIWSYYSFAVVFFTCSWEVSILRGNECLFISFIPVTQVFWFSSAKRLICSVIHLVTLSVHFIITPVDGDS